ncbi:hypothetical protein MYX75_12755 [Acidobacteria bacterium AH-259-A15]|nr:hypothetical protein [Acidobacteria bacterium AH-259-A15]
MLFPKKAAHWNLSAVVILLAVCALALAKGPKMKPEELVARHLEALGSPEARATVHSRSAKGAGRLTLISGSGSLNGPASFVTEGRKVLLSIQFNHLQYAAERISFDGDKTQVGDIRTGIRSQLGEMLYKEYNSVIKEGLLGGVLSTAWPLLELESRRPKLKYEGLKKVNDQELLALKYRMRKGGGNLNISLYFDPQTFHHVAAIHKFWIPAPMGFEPQESSIQRESRFKLEEWFSNFQTTDGLNLPTQWTIRLSIETGRGTYLAKWDMIYNQITHNLSIDPQRFVLF